MPPFRSWLVSDPECASGVGWVGRWFVVSWGGGFVEGVGSGFGLSGGGITCVRVCVALWVVGGGWPGSRRMRCQDWVG